MTHLTVDMLTRARVLSASLPRQLCPWEDVLCVSTLVVGRTVEELFVVRVCCSTALWLFVLVL